MFIVIIGVTERTQKTRHDVDVYSLQCQMSATNEKTIDQHNDACNREHASYTVWPKKLSY